MNPSSVLWNIVSLFACSFLKNETIRQFFSLPRTRQLRLLASLARHCKSIESSEKEGFVYSSWRYWIQWIRPNFQLPCSYQTRLKRADWIEGRYAKDTPILLLGDDDLLSVELSARGFSNLTAADCDVQVLNSIRLATHRNACKPQIALGNFLDKNFLNETGAELVCIDPPYNLKWSHVFIEQALRSAGTSETRQVDIILMLNPNCISSKERSQLWEVFAKQGFHMSEQISRFNSYPLRGISRSSLRLAIRLALGAESLPNKDLHFASDLFLFERQKIDLEKTKS